MVAPTFTARQGQYLAFIHGFTARHGVAPSFEEIGAHFGTSAPSVNGMIKTLERRGLLSRVPGVARSLRVRVPASMLTEGDFRPGGGGSRKTRTAGPPQLSAGDAAVAGAVAVLERLLPAVPPEQDRTGLVARAAQDVRSALAAGGLEADEAQQVAARIAAEAARWQPDGRGTIVRRRRWVRK